MIVLGVFFSLFSFEFFNSIEIYSVEWMSDECNIPYISQFPFRYQQMKITSFVRNSAKNQWLHYLDYSFFKKNKILPTLSCHYRSLVRFWTEISVLHKKSYEKFFIELKFWSSTLWIQFNLQFYHIVFSSKMLQDFRSQCIF